MFPEDATISMEMLIQLATGSELISGEMIILAMVNHLKISSLLLNSEEYNDTKVHDVIRSVARTEAFTDSNFAFLQETCNSRHLPYNASYRTRKFFRLDVETTNVHFCENLVCPDLHTLWLQCNKHPQQFSGDFFTMFVNLNFLMLQNVIISLEQFSLQPLGNLGTLTLLNCDIVKTDASLFPKSLKTLCICYCDLPSPLDIANLEYLLKLEIQKKPKPKLVMVSNFMASLSSLEELYIPKGFINDDKEYQMEPIAMEISKLTHLKSLQFQFYDDVTFEGTDIFSNLDRYNISVGDAEYYYKGVSSTRSIELWGNQWKSWEGLMARAEEVILVKSDVEVSSICNGQRRAFEGLKILCIKDCDMGHVASISQEKIQPSLSSAKCFSKLTILDIVWCSKMKYLFCNNIARNLGQLQELSVSNCESMEAIIMNEGGNGDVIILSKLKSLELSNMPILSGFYAEKRNMHLDSTLSMDPCPQYQPLFDEMIAFPSLEGLVIVDLRDISVIWGNDCCNDTHSSFCKLNYLVVDLCDKLESVIPSAMLHRLNHLTRMIVGSGNEMREIIRVGEQAITDGILFPELKVLELKSLRSLRRFWCYQSGNANTSKVPLLLPQLSSLDLQDLPHLKSFFHGVNFEFHTPALKILSVNNCGISTLFTFSMFRKFQLENLGVRNCELLENIVEDLREDETCDKIIKLSQLTRVALSELPKLKSFFHNANFEFHMPVVKTVAVHECGLSYTLFTRSVFENLKKLEELLVSNCELLEGIFEDARGAETVDTSNKIITLDQVSKVHLQGLPKFKTIFYGATYECYMPGLKNVKIVGCGGSILFTCSVFRGIPQLEELHVSNCESLEHVVKEVGGDETSELNDKSIRSSQFSSITFESLPNLKSFSCTSMSYVFSMPKLQKFKLIKCPQIEYFSSLKTNTSSVHVTSGWCSDERFQDLNDFIRENHKRCQDLGTQSGRIEEEEEEEATETESDSSDD